MWLYTKHSCDKITWICCMALFFIVQSSLSVTDKRMLQVLQQLFPDAKHLSSLHSNAWLKVINQQWRMLVSFIFSFHTPPLIVTSHWVHCPFAINNLGVGMSWSVELPVSVSKNRSRHAKYCFHSTVPYKSLLFRQWVIVAPGVDEPPRHAVGVCGRCQRLMFTKESRANPCQEGPLMNGLLMNSQVRVNTDKTDVRWHGRNKILSIP